MSVILCKSCKHWSDRPDGALLSEPRRTDGAGYCKRFSHAEALSDAVQAVPVLAAFFDGGELADVEFITPPGFGCVLGKPKDVNEEHSRCAVCRYETGKIAPHPILCEDCIAKVVPAAVEGEFHRELFALGYAAAAFAQFERKGRVPLTVKPAPGLDLRPLSAHDFIVVKDQTTRQAHYDLREKLRTLELEGWTRGEPYDGPNGLSFDGWPIRRDLDGLHILAFRWVPASSPFEPSPRQASTRVPVPDEVADFIRSSCNVPRT